MFVAEGPFFAIGHDRKPIGVDSEFHEIVPNGLRALFTEHEIVCRRPPLVTMPFDFDACGRVRLEPVGIADQRLPAFFRDGPAIVTKKHIAQSGSR